MARYPPELESARILARLEGGGHPTGERWWRLFNRRAPWLAAAAVVALLVVVAPSLRPMREATHRVKGEEPASLSMVVNRPEGPRPVEAGGPLAARDQVQFRYRSGGLGHALVVSVDGEGRITPLYPAEGGTSLAVEVSGEHVLPGSVILDEARGPERVIAFFSEQPLTLAAVLPAVERALAAAGRDPSRMKDVPLEVKGRVSQAGLWFRKIP